MNLNKMRVILADSNEIVRIGLRTLLSTDKNIQIVGEAKSDEELLERVFQSMSSPN
jgi:DNA-binding NarL/FixJ family response regulator